MAPRSVGCGGTIPVETTLNVYQLLRAVNQQAVNGLLYNGNVPLRRMANDLFSALN